MFKLIIRRLVDRDIQQVGLGIDVSHQKDIDDGSHVWTIGIALFVITVELWIGRDVRHVV